MAPREASKTFKEQADQKLKSLAAKQEEWSAATPQVRAAALAEVQLSQRQAFERLAEVSDACVKAQGFDSEDDPEAVPAWCLEQVVNAAMLAGWVSKMKATFEAVANTSRCPAPISTRQAADGRWIADVFPMDSSDRYGPKKAWKAEVWMQEGKEATQGAGLTTTTRAGSCALVLGAGNVGALAISDCLHVMFQCNRVCLLKVHSLRTYQENLIKDFFRPLMARGIFDIIVEESGVPDAVYLVKHPLLSQIHMTGATETHDAIVWGPIGERESRISRNNPVTDLEKVEVTSELGCVTPYMICPAHFTEEELQHHAQHLAVCISMNNSYLCNSPKVLVLAEEWPQRDAFVDRVRNVLRALPNPPPYYPGSHNRYERLVKAYPAESVEKIEGPGCSRETRFGSRIPWTFVKISADAERLEDSKKEYAFREEPFCPVLNICTLRGTAGPQQYLEAVTKLSNECLWGTLSCSLVVHPEVEAAVPEAVEKALAELKYGAVVLNCWSGEAYSFDHALWGGYQGADSVEKIQHVESGIGFVGNCLLFDHPAKCVIRSPFMAPDHIGCGAPWTKEVMIRLTNFIVAPSLKSFMKMTFPGLCAPRCCCAGRRRPAATPTVAVAGATSLTTQQRVDGQPLLSGAA